MVGNTSDRRGESATPSELIRLTRPLPEPHLLVSAAGGVLAANPAARRTFDIDEEPADVALRDMVTEQPEKVDAFLRSASRSTSLVPGAFTLRMADGATKRFGCSGGLVQHSGPGQQTVILVRFRPHEKTIPGFLLLNERILELTRALHQRREAQEALETHSADLLALTEDLERQKEEAQAANRAKSSFLAAMSHELRTPLNGILGYVDLMDLSLEGPLTEGQRNQLHRIRRSTAHLASIINEILQFSQLEAQEVEVQLETVDLVEVVQQAADMIEPAFVEAHLYLERLLPETPVNVQTDQVKVRQILLNLLSNAVKFTPRGTIRMRVVEGPEEVRVSVVDPGIGIEAAHLERIFEPFWQVRRGAGGTGLGLPVTRQLAQRLGGDIEVESTPGAGTTFTLVLPGSRDAKRILLVEDDVDTQHVYRAILVHAGFEVFVAENGRDAVRLAREEMPDLILMDIDLPILNGWEATELLREEPATERIPIMGVSGGTTEESFRRATELGFEAYHTKPFPPSEVLAEVRRLCGAREASGDGVGRG